MLNELAKKLKSLKLNYYKSIELHDNILVINTANLSEKPCEPCIFDEAVHIVQHIEKNIYDFVYDGETDKIIITITD